MASSWEDLRRRARTAENNIDVKLVSLNKLNSHTTRLDLEEKTATARQAVFDSLVQEIDALITKLSIINDEMCELIALPSSSGWSQSPAVQHTLRRHQEILRDYRTEFRRARENVQQQLQREILLAGNSEPSCLNNRVKASDMYLKENEHIGSCDRLLDEQISIAMSTKENLSRQSMSLRGITRKVQSMTQKYPMLNNVMQKIQRKKQKDAIVVGLVISACLIFTFFYLFH